MKHLILFFAILTLANFAIAQNTEINKSHFVSAKQDIENMLNGKEEPDYEKAIFLIENAYYENNINKTDYDFAMQNHINSINIIIKTNYNFEATNPKPSLLYSKEQLEQLYNKALKNWAIYTYITSSTIYFDSLQITYHKNYNYSFADPMASNDWANTQVTNLNGTHQGNCFALASLFKILSNRLNSEAKLCTAPSHIYISHKDNKGIAFNVELGSKTFAGTGTLATLTHSTMESIKNDIALRELNEKQAVALCLIYLAKGYEHKFNNSTDDFILQCAETTIKYDDKNLNALLLKAEYLENKITAQHKTITQLQPQKEFKEYQTLITYLYNLGYREIPLQMKNQLIKGWSRDSITKLANVAYKTSEAELSKLLQARQASLSWGLFEENFTDKPTERISNTLFNTKTKKITSFVKDQKLYNNYNFDPVVFAWNIDPLTSKLPFASPYAFCLNNPILMFDKDGAYPFTIHVRSFHPNNTFGSLNGFYGNGFSGDSRGFSLSTASDVTSRVNHQFTFDVDKGTTTYDKTKDTWSNASHDSKGNTKTAKPRGEVSEMTKNGNLGTFNTSYAANNPLATGSPDIDVKANFAIYEDTKKGLLTVGMNAFGDDFPNTEAFITDASGNSVFLGVDVREPGNDDAPFLLGGGPTTNTMKALFSISLDKKGNFTGIQASGKKYTLEEWNNKHTSVDAKPTDKK